MPPFERSEHHPFKEPAARLDSVSEKATNKGLWMEDWKSLGF